MICVIMMIAAAVISIIAIIRSAMGYDNAVELIITVMLVVGLAVFNMGMRVSYNNTCEYLHNEYKEITMLYDAIEQSDSEYLRYNFYERIENYNEQYTTYVKDLNNPWFNWLVYNDIDDIDSIEFNWRNVPNAEI